MSSIKGAGVALFCPFAALSRQLTPSLRATNPQRPPQSRESDATRPTRLDFSSKAIAAKWIVEIRGVAKQIDGVRWASWQGISGEIHAQRLKNSRTEVSGSALVLCHRARSGLRHDS